MKMRSRRPFSLLEIVICIALLACISGFLGIQIKQTIDHQRFESSAAQLLSDLRRVQSLALSYQGEFNLTILKEGESYTYAFFSDEPREAVKRLPRGTLTGVTSLSLDEKQKEKFSIDIFATGRLDPPKKLKLESKDQAVSLDLGSPLRLIRIQKEAGS